NLVLKVACKYPHSFHCFPASRCSLSTRRGEHLPSMKIVEEYWMVLVRIPSSWVSSLSIVRLSSHCRYQYLCEFSLLSRDDCDNYYRMDESTTGGLVSR